MLEQQDRAVDPVGSIEMVIDTSIYSETVVFKTSYWFTERAYVELLRVSSSAIRVRLTGRTGRDVPRQMAGEFQNALIDQKVRELVSAETAEIRDLIVRQAFAEAGDDVRSNSSTADDGPRR